MKCIKNGTFQPLRFTVSIRGRAKRIHVIWSITSLVIVFESISSLSQILQQIPLYTRMIVFACGNLISQFAICIAHMSADNNIHNDAFNGPFFDKHEHFSDACTTDAHAVPVTLESPKVAMSKLISNSRQIYIFA